MSKCPSVKDIIKMEMVITDKVKNIIVCAVFILAGFLIVFRFTEVPMVWIDEGIFTNTAENLASNGSWGLQTSPSASFRLGPQLTTNYPVILPVAASINLFGKGIWQSRLPMVVYMFILVVLFYFFVRKRYGFYPALVSVLLLISFSPFYGNGRSVQGEVPGLVFIILGSILLLYFEESNFENKKLALFSGFFLGLAASTKSVYVALLTVALFIVTLFWFRKFKDIKTMAVFGLSFLVPVLGWLFINFPTKSLMAGILPMFLHQAGNNGASSMSDTSLSTLETVSVNLARFVSESTPILFLFVAVSVLFYFTFKHFRKIEKNISMAESVILFFVVLNWFGYLMGTGWYRYFFPAHVLLYLFFSVAIVYFANLISNKFFKKIILLVPILLVAFQFYHLIYLSETSFVGTRSRNHDLTEALSSIMPTQKILFHNTIEAIIFFPGQNYSQYLLMPGLFEAGDRNSIHDSSNDFILTNNIPEEVGLVSSCYTGTQVSRYVLFKKKSNCEI